MAVITPGIDFIARNAFLASCRAGLAGAILRLLASSLHLNVARWQLILAAILSSPALTIASNVVYGIRIRRRAAALGARPMPQVRTRLPGNLDFLQRNLVLIREGYPGLWTSEATACTLIQLPQVMASMSSSNSTGRLST